MEYKTETDWTEEKKEEFKFIQEFLNKYLDWIIEKSPPDYEQYYYFYNIKTK